MVGSNPSLDILKSGYCNFRTVLEFLFSGREFGLWEIKSPVKVEMSNIDQIYHILLIAPCSYNRGSRWGNFSVTGYSYDIVCI